VAFSLRIRAHSEIGLVRTNNQDSAYVSPSLIVVADGMGGAAAGDLASAVAIRELARADEVNRAPRAPGVPPPPEDPLQPTLDFGGPVAGEPRHLAGEQMLESLGGALSKANDTLADLVVWDHSLEGMGTTVCGAMFSGTQYGICHIGDSRGYLVRDGGLRRLTHDHSWVQSLVDEGKISPEDAATHPHRSLLLKVLTGQPTHTPDFHLVDAQLGDRLLFCSDGLCGMVDDDVIHHLLTSNDSLDQALTDLTAAAHAGGGLDNITIIVADVVEYSPGLEAASPRVLGAASTVEIPQVDATHPIDLGDGSEDTQRLHSHVPTAPVPLAPAPGTPPEGVIDPDRFEAYRYTPKLAGRRLRWMPLVITFVLLAALGVGALLGARAYVTSQYFIGPRDDNVAVYRGLPDEFIGRSLAEVVEDSSIRIDDLPPYYAGLVRDSRLRYDNADEAREQLDKLDQMARKCIAERAAGQSPTPETPSTSPADPSTPTDQSTPGDADSSSPAETAATVTPGTPSGSPTSSTSDRPDLEACG